MRRIWAALRGVDAEVWLLLGLSVFAWAPLAAPGYFLKAHDAPHTIFFLNAFDQTLRDGYLIPRWSADFALGYGYPLFLFLSPLAYYVAEAFHLLGAGLTVAVKLTFAFSFVLSGLAMYALGRRLFGRSAGLLAGVLYIYAPYHLVDVTVRGDLAESFAYIFMPLTMLAFLALLENPGRRNLAWAGLSYAGLLLAHNGTALIFTPVLVVWILFLLGRAAIRTPARGDAPAAGGAPRAALQGGLWALGGAALAAGLSAFFLLPAFLERQYIVEQQWVQGSFSYLKHFIYPGQFFSPFWGYGYAGEGLADQMPFQLGLAPVVFALAGLLLPWKLPGRRGRRDFFFAVTLVALFFMLPISAALWNAAPLAALIQFPWRLLLITSLSLALLGGCAAAGLQAQPAWLLAGVLALIVALGSFAYTLPQYTEPSPRSEADVAVVDFELVYPPDRTGMTAWTQEQPLTSPLAAQYLAGEPLIKAHVIAGAATIEPVHHGGGSDVVIVRAETPATIEFYTYYFPGWQARVDGRPVPIRPSGKFGLIALDTPAGEHQVVLRFRDTPVRIMGEVISALCLGGLAGLLAWPARRRKPAVGSAR